MDVLFFPTTVPQNSVSRADGLGRVVIGDNVFIGVGSIVLPNVT